MESRGWLCSKTQVKRRPLRCSPDGKNMIKCAWYGGSTYEKTRWSALGVAFQQNNRKQRHVLCSAPHAGVTAASDSQEYSQPVLQTTWWSYLDCSKSRGLSDNFLHTQLERSSTFLINLQEWRGNQFSQVSHLAKPVYSALGGALYSYPTCFSQILVEFQNKSALLLGCRLFLLLGSGEHSCLGLAGEWSSYYCLWTWDCRDTHHHPGNRWCLTENGWMDRWMDTAHVGCKPIIRQTAAVPELHGSNDTGKDWISHYFILSIC